jgi:hypothetical protein
MKQSQRAICVLLALAICLALAACGSGAGEDAAPGTAAEDFYGTWKYDNYEDVVVLNEDGTWDAYSADGTYAGSSNYDFADGKVTLKDGKLNVSAVLSVSGSKLVDGDGDTLSRYELVIDQGPVLPSSDDPLTQSILMEDAPIPLEVWYPETMEGHAQQGYVRRLSFNALNGDGTDEDYTNISVTLLEIGSGYDQYMNRGTDMAKQGMQALLNDYLATAYQHGQLLKSIGFDFVDGGWYYSITGYLWLDGSVFTNPTSQPVRSTLEIRYVGPTGYALLVHAISVEPRIQTYYEIACNMASHIDYGGDWSTKAKPVPAGQGGGGAWSDSGDYGDTYYWYDSDGDVWYWNGYEDVFIGFGDDYYIDDDGEYYESNDAGWDDDYYDYYDDYDPWSDPGDGDDYWSDPGDTDYYEDDGEYYESQDADW